MARLETHASIKNLCRPLVLKVLSPDEMAASPYSPEDCAVLLDARQVDGDLPIKDAGALVLTGSSVPPQVSTPVVLACRDPNVVGPGDVIRLNPSSSLVKVLYRRDANSNVLFVTERCNSGCLMCSQPPRSDDDRWRIAELLKLIPLIDDVEQTLAITGGEPTLLGSALADVIGCCAEFLPTTSLHILSNGRSLSDRAFAQQLAAARHPRLSWGIPLYADSPEIHDYVVQANGAFEETVSGLYNLAELGQRLEIRIVLTRPTLSRIEELAYFIFQNLPFVDHVAFMGMEPIGFAPGNRDALWADPSATSPALERAVLFLTHRGIATSLYNLPLCVVPKSLWGHYRRSISDWKNTYVEACSSCEAQEICGGFFASIRANWIPTDVHPLAGAELASPVRAPVWEAK